MEHSIHNPRLNRDIFKAISKGKLKINKTAIALLLHLAPFIDRDGRIQLDKEMVRKQLYCNHRTFEAALLELLQTSYNGKTLVSYENGYIVSNFHIFTTGKEVTYLKHLKFFNDPKFLDLTMNQIRLFLYVATLNVNKDQWKKVAIENLYKNKLHDMNYGMHVYDDYKCMTEDLFHLIELDLIQVRLPGESNPIDKKNPNYKEIFHSYFGYSGKKKGRTSKNFKKKHSIGLQVNPAVFGEKKDAVKNIASETEMRLLGDCYHMFIEDLRTDTFNFFIGEKKNLIEQFGLAGLQIYRSSLEKYFKEKNENILYYDIKRKAKNYFTDFYLLEEIKKVILAAIKSELGDWGAIAATGYTFTKAHIPTLVAYFIDKSCDEHKILIDEDIQLIKHAHELMSEVSSKEPWTTLQMSIDTVYSKHIILVDHILIRECIKNELGDPYNILGKINKRDLIVSLAKNSLLSIQKNIDNDAEKLKQIVRFFRQKQIPFLWRFQLEFPEKQSSGVSRPHNWLEE